MKQADHTKLGRGIAPHSDGFETGPPSRGGAEHSAKESSHGTPASSDRREPAGHVAVPEQASEEPPVDGAMAILPKEKPPLRVYDRIKSAFAVIGVLASLWFGANLVDAFTQRDSAPDISPAGDYATFMYMGDGKQLDLVHGTRQKLVDYARSLGWEDEDTLRDEMTPANYGRDAR